ncbi:MAG: NAD(P)-binding protein [Desulfobacterales bacterium]|jgi:flavin-dependent dehydrogenase
MQSVKILGGGIAGLTAAINLKRAGINVEVHERKEFCGKATCDFQFMENWIFEEDALAALKKFNITGNFYVKPWYSLEFISPSLNRCLRKSAEPIVYGLKRGPEEGAIDDVLQKQVTDAHIPIIFNSTLAADDATIIAIGRNNPNFTITGISFPFDHPDAVIVYYDDRLSLKMYTYITVTDRVGQLVVINPAERTDHEARLELGIKRFEDIFDGKISTITHRFAAPGSLNFLKKAKIEGRYYVGEAAGFQDGLAGFGLMYAFRSGYHAAQSIIQNDDFDLRWQADMLKPMEVSHTNRYLFEKLSNEGYEKLVNMLDSQNPVIVKLLGGVDLKDVLKKMYNDSPSHLLRPILF